MLVDPLDPQNNVGRTCFGVLAVQHHFANALAVIQASLAPARAVTTPASSSSGVDQSHFRGATPTVRHRGRSTSPLHRAVQPERAPPSHGSSLLGRVFSTHHHSRVTDLARHVYLPTPPKSKPRPTPAPKPAPPTRGGGQGTQPPPSVRDVVRATIADRSASVNAPALAPGAHQVAAWAQQAYALLQRLHNGARGVGDPNHGRCCVVCGEVTPPTDAAAATTAQRHKPGCALAAVIAGYDTPGVAVTPVQPAPVVPPP